MSRALVLVLLLPMLARAGDANRYTYLDGSDSYYVSRTFPRLTTPQWVGEPGVDAVVVLAIDDMRGYQRWEKYLRPILERLKKIDRRAPVSIMTCRVNPKEPHLQKWLKEGVSIEVHTYDHPCPILKGGDWKTAKATYDKCVDLLNTIPNNKPVAFRTPCCDSLNTPSPRMFATIFNARTPKGNFLSIDSSVFNIFTPDDPELPRKLVLEGTQSRFAKYLPKDRAFGNLIENYPYPYVLGGLCWQFPCMTPSDWQAQHLLKPNNPITLRDWQAALDATVIKKGVFNLVFHPHGWIKAEQVIDLIDYAGRKHGKKIKFLTFKECHDRITKHLLAGQTLRDAKGEDNGVRLLDLNGDGFLDVVIGNARKKLTRIWNPKTNRWIETSFPISLAGTGARFGVLGGKPIVMGFDTAASIWRFDKGKWTRARDLSRRLSLTKEIWPSVRLRDLNGDDNCELIVGSPKHTSVVEWTAKINAWRPLKFSLPPGTSIVHPKGGDAGLRFVDINEDGHDDILFSNEERYGLWLFQNMKVGWGKKVLAGKRTDKNALPMIARNGRNNGAWFFNRELWVQNEHTAARKDLVHRVSFNQMLKDMQPGPKSPEASLRCIRTRPGFRVELVAAEPLVQDPIAFAFGPDGKLWVVEMGDYPNGIDGKGKPGGKIKFLEDLNGDGKYDKATVFLENVGFPSSIAPWRNGVLITAAPEIFFAEDTNGDGKADKRKTLYRGFGEGNQQHRVNTLAWGLDNCLHIANGDSAGKIRSAITGKSIDIRGRDLRIRPDDGFLQAETGQTQFGRARDDWGNWFGGNNSNPAWHFVLQDRYLKRNPHVAPPNLRVSVPEIPGNSPVYPRSRTLPRFNQPHTANRFTSACSPIIYRDTLFGLEFAGNLFISEPVHNLVHRQIVSPNGFTFRSRRADDEAKSEFLASSDNWFRPTMIRIGPDGALWIADMYRHVIEHPKWIPKNWQARLNLRAGHDRGRIYRVVPIGSKRRGIPRIDRLSAGQLVAALDSPNGWQRDLAHQMLLWKQDKSSVLQLKQMARNAKRPQARLHALCVLDGLGAINGELLREKLADPHPGVRRHAIRIAETRLNKDPKLGPALLNLVDDKSSQVRLQLACSLGEWKDPRGGIGLAKLLARNTNDVYLTAAVNSSLHKRNISATVVALLKQSNNPQSIARLLKLSQALGNEDAVTALLEKILTTNNGQYAAWQYKAIGTIAPQRELTADLKNKLRAMRTSARTIVADRKADVALRVSAMSVLTPAEDAKRVAAFLTLRSPQPLQIAAVEFFSRHGKSNTTELLLARWRGCSPAIRLRILDLMLQRTASALALLDAIKTNRVASTEVDLTRRQKLLAHPEQKVRAAAKAVFVETIESDRSKLIARYRSHTAAGDAARGKALFKKHCAVCHKFKGEGTAIGADLASLKDRSREAMLTAVLDPNRAVEAKFVGYLVRTNDGRTLSGLLRAETATSITLIGSDGKPVALLRKEIRSLRSTGKSAMPDGFEKLLTPAQLADVIKHISTR